MYSVYGGIIPGEVHADSRYCFISQASMQLKQGMMPKYFGYLHKHVYTQRNAPGQAPAQ